MPMAAAPSDTYPKVDDIVTFDKVSTDPSLSGEKTEDYEEDFEPETHPRTDSLRLAEVHLFLKNRPLRDGIVCICSRILLDDKDWSQANKQEDCKGNTYFSLGDILMDLSCFAFQLLLPRQTKRVQQLKFKMS